MTGLKLNRRVARNNSECNAPSTGLAPTSLEENKHTGACSLFSFVGVEKVLSFR